MSYLVAVLAMSLGAWMAYRGAAGLFPCFTAYLAVLAGSSLFWQPNNPWYCSHVYPVNAGILILLLTAATLEWSEYAIVALCDGSRRYVRAMYAAAAAGLLMLAWFAPAGEFSRWLAYRQYWMLGLVIICAATGLYVRLTRTRQFSVVSDHGTLLLVYLGISWVLAAAGDGGPVWRFIERTGSNWSLLDFVGLFSTIVLITMWFLVFGGYDDRKEPHRGQRA